MKKTLLFLTTCLYFVSCAVDQHFELPKGEPGAAGESAYEAWLKLVEGDEEYRGGKDLEDFFLYLMGQEGVDGENGSDGDDGIDGAEGKSAYALWVDYVSKGNVPHPLNANEIWPPERTSMPDFYAFLSGASGSDGQSAYELWKAAVLSPNGLENPRTVEIDYWDKNKVSEGDFLEYLTGRDGLDGADGKPGPAGEPGANVTIQIGKYNVVAQYSLQEASEYVRWTDGSVLYKVYDKQGVLLKNAEITGMPGVDPNVKFYSDDNGEFKILKEDLPVGVEETSRFGTATVNGEPTAANTYVPERVAVRLHYTASPYSSTSSNYLYLQFVYQRRMTANGEWEDHPTWITNQINTTIKWYKVSDPQNPKSFTDADQWAQTRTSSMAMKYAYLYRPIKHSDHWQDAPVASTSANSLWDGNYYNLTMVAEPYYGDVPVADKTVFLPPIQRMPILYSVTATGYAPAVAPASASVATMKGRWRTSASDVDYDLFYHYMSVEDGNNYKFNRMTKAEADAVKVFRVTFRQSEGDATSEIYNDVGGTLIDPTFTISKHIYVGSTVSLGSASTSGQPMQMFNYTASAFADFTLTGTDPSTGLSLQPVTYAPFANLPIIQVTLE